MLGTGPGELELLSGRLVLRCSARHGWLANAGFAGSSEALVVDGAARHFTWAFTLGKADGSSEVYFVNAHMTS